MRLEVIVLVWLWDWGLKLHVVEDEGLRIEDRLFGVRAPDVRVSLTCLNNSQDKL